MGKGEGELQKGNVDDLEKVYVIFRFVKELDRRRGEEGKLWWLCVFCILKVYLMP